MFFTPRWSRASRTVTFCSCKGVLLDDGQVDDIVQAEDLLELEGGDSQGLGVVTGPRPAPGDAVDIASSSSLLYLYLAHPAVRITCNGAGALGELGVVVAALGQPSHGQPDHALGWHRSLTASTTWSARASTWCRQSRPPGVPCSSSMGEGQAWRGRSGRKNPCAPGGSAPM